MTPEASGASPIQSYREDMLDSLNRVGRSFYGTNCQFDGAVGFLYAARDPQDLVYLPQYVRRLARSFPLHTVLIMRSLLDISTNMDVATRVLLELRRLDTIDEVFVSGISEQIPFVDYVEDIRKYYGLPKTMKPLRLRMPEQIVSFADRMQAQGLPYSDISDTLMVTKSQIQAYRKKLNLGKTYTSEHRKTLNEEDRTRLRKECHTVIAGDFDMRFAVKKLNLLGDFSLKHTVSGGTKMR